MIMFVLRNSQPISTEPTEHLYHWMIIILPNGDRHFCGVRRNATTVRVSSKIVLFNKAEQTGMTRSSRMYYLEGPPGKPDWLWLAVASWCQHNGVNVNEVTFCTE
jgi:hypothetical protein